MYRNQKIIVVMPAYEAEQPLVKTYEEVMAQGIVDQVIVVDDNSRDDTVDIAKNLPGTIVHKHERYPDEFVFDNQILAQILWYGYTIAEVNCPINYFAEASSINFSRSIKYEFNCLETALTFRAARTGLLSSDLFRRID